MRGLSSPFGRRRGLSWYPPWSTAYCGWRGLARASLLRLCDRALWDRSLPCLYCTRHSSPATALSTALPRQLDLPLAGHRRKNKKRDESTLFGTAFISRRARTACRLAQRQTLPRGLPDCDGRKLVDEIEHIERKVVPYHVSHENLQRESKYHDRPYGKPPGKNKTAYHRECIENRINNTVPCISLRERLFAVVVDYHGRVFDDFPGDLNAYREEEPLPHLHSREKVPKAKVKKKAVNDVREGVPVRQVLGIPAA